MKFMTYTYNNEQNVGIIKENKIIPINDVLNKLRKASINSMNDLIQMYNEDDIYEIEHTVNSNDFSTISLDSITVLPPIPNPKRNILCIGKNYIEHAKEIQTTKISATGIPEVPIYFTKGTSPIASGEYIKFSYDVTKEVDYESELAVIIGKDGINISAEEAEEYIFGYTVVNDVSARDLQVKHSQWFKAKSLDTFCPMGPYIVHKNELPFPIELNIRGSVNGELRQDSNTKNMIFSIPYIISNLSKGLTLKAGDIICTGTPSGVGMGFKPPKLLKDGDVIECYIERIGKLINKVKVI